MKGNIAFLFSFLFCIQSFAQGGPVPPTDPDTASGTIWLNAEEKEMVKTLNILRLDPGRFAEDNLRSNPDPVAQEAYVELLNTAPMGLLQPSQALIYAAEDHARDMGINAKTGNKGTDQSMPSDRIKRYGDLPGVWAENTHYGNQVPLEIILQLLIDDGNPTRVHRRNILNRDMKFVGVAIRPHATIRWNTVQVFAGDHTCKSGLMDRPPYRQPDRKPDEEDTMCHGFAIFDSTVCPGDGLSPKEKELVELINQYRNEHSLPSVSISQALTKTANRHVLNLAEMGALTHAWSNCPYNAGDESTFHCMWEAPKRMNTSYQAYAYENAFTGSGKPNVILFGWQKSEPHNAVLLNRDQWKEYDWRAIGVAIYKGIAVMWVGQEYELSQPTDEDDFKTLDAPANVSPLPLVGSLGDTVHGPPYPDFKIYDTGYWVVSLGGAMQPTPGDTKGFMMLNLGYLWVNEGFAHLFLGEIGLGGASQIFGAGYGFGVGIDSGKFHLGGIVSLGYAHIWDTDHVHGIYLGLGPMVMGTLWHNWHFILTLQWSAMPWSSVSVPNGMAWSGFTGSLGVGFHF